MNRSFQGLTISIFLLLIFPWIIQDGMFMDGMIYATVARNLALGIGSWWDLHLTNFLSENYFDQPPLTIWITSAFFKLLGYSMYTERIYSFTAAILNLLLIKLIWQKINCENKIQKDNWWLPVLFWIIPPACFWSFTNNMEENTMSVFILLSVYFVIDFYQRKKGNLMPVLLMTFCIFLATMCKGIQGSFTLIALLTFALIIERTKIKSAIKFSLISIITLFVLSTLLYFYEPSHRYLTGYYKTRLVSTFTNPNVATTSNRFYLIFRLLSEEFISIILCILILLWKSQKNIWINLESRNRKLAIYFLIIAAAGTIPLLITTEQRRFYLVPTFPFYAFALSFLIIDKVVVLMDHFKKFHFKIRILGISILAATIILTITNIGTSKRDKEMLHDINKIGKLVPENTNISIEHQLYSTWILHLYFQRYYGISLQATDDKTKNPYYLTAKKPVQLENMEIVNLNLKEFDLHKANSKNELK